MSIASILGFGSKPTDYQTRAAQFEPEHATTSGRAANDVAGTFNANLMAAAQQLANNQTTSGFSALDAETTIEPVKTMDISGSVPEGLAHIGDSFGGIELGANDEPVYHEAPTSDTRDFMVNTKDGGQILYIADPENVGQRVSPENQQLTPAATKATVAMNGAVSPKLNNFDPVGSGDVHQAQLAGLVSKDGDQLDGMFIYLPPAEAGQSNDSQHMNGIPQVAA